jgi:phosphoribosylformylglycinamidine cyclo-ligase
VSEAYRRAGVDLGAAAEAVERIGHLAKGAMRAEVAEGVGGFAGLFRIGEGRLLAAATDGVGTKLEIARRAGRLGTVGIDLVAMCANDVVCTGAEPLFFLTTWRSGASSLSAWRLWSAVSRRAAAERGARSSVGRPPSTRA